MWISVLASFVGFTAWSAPASSTLGRASSRVSPPRATGTFATDSPVIPFEDWAEANGINAPKLAVTGKDELRGVLMLDNAESGEEICCVPRTSCLDLSAVEGAGSPCEALVPSALWVTLRWYERLACWLLAEQRRGAESPVAGYMGYLPKPDQFADAPLSWDDDELSLLAYPPVAASIREQAAELDELHASLRRAGGALAPSVSRDELQWAMQLVLSRAFTSTIATPEDVARLAPPPPPPPADPATVAARTWLGQVPLVGGLLAEKPPPPPPPAAGDGLCMAMMPMLDAFNHDSSAANECAYDSARNAFVLTAGAPLRKGEEAYLSYGDKSNDELLQLFGFVEPNNPHDAFLSIGLADYVRSPASGLFASPQVADARFARLESLARESPAELEDALVGELRASGAAPRVMLALRLLLGSRDEIETAGPAAQRLAAPASLATEERVWAALRGYCKMARSAMGGPRKADLEGAKAAARDGDARRALALTFRSEKKRLLSELENRLTRRAARSRKAGRVVKG